MAGQESRAHLEKGSMAVVGVSGQRTRGHGETRLGLSGCPGRR